MRYLISKFLGVLAAAGLFITLAAGIASASTASPHPSFSFPVSSYTAVTSDPDSGNGGTWAYDGFGRLLVTTPQGNAPAADCGGLSPCHAYTATLSDSGEFTTIPGVLAPNQSGAFAGDKILSRVTGIMTGTGQFGTFYSTGTPSAFLVPRRITGSPDSGNFPARMFTKPVFGLNEEHFAYYYTAFTPAHGIQRWADTDTDGYGNTLRAGQITG